MHANSQQKNEYARGHGGSGNGDGRMERNEKRVCSLANANGWNRRTGHRRTDGTGVQVETNG